MPAELKTDLDKSDALNHNLFIVWKPEYNLGIPIIDEQHRAIVTTINTLYYEIQNKRGESILKPVVAMIDDYTRIHFNLEEAFLKKCEYPDFDNHHELHNELLHDQAKIARESMGNRDPSTYLNFLKHWWINHICEKDRAFKNFLSQ